MKRSLVFVCLLVAGAGPASRPTRDLPPTYACGSAKGEIVIDGSTDEAAWESAAWTEDFIDVLGAAAKPDAPALRTRAKMLYDANNLYLAAEMAAPRVAARITQRDEQLYREQVFELFLDPGGDGRHYLELQVNPLNTVCDLVMSKPYRERGRPEIAFDLEGLRTAVKVRGTLNDDGGDADEGWTLEIAIPWRALRRVTRSDAAPAPDERWRMNLARMHPADAPEKDRRECWVWSAQGEMNLHAPQRWGWVTFSAQEPQR